MSTGAWEEARVLKANVTEAWKRRRKKEKKRRSQALSVQNPVWVPGSIPTPPGPAGIVAGTVLGLVPGYLVAL